MKFRGLVVNVPLLAGVTASLSRVGRTGWVRLSPTTVNFIMLPISANSTTQVWSALPRDSIFLDYICQSAANNVIDFEVSLDQLSRLLKAFLSAEDVVIKLTKKESLPMLSISAKITSANTVTHLIPITLLAPASVAHLSEPLCPPTTLHILLPPMRHVSERYKSLSSMLILSANLNGELKLGIKTDVIKCETHWRNLMNPEVREDDDEDQTARQQLDSRERERFCRLRISGKDWTNVLHIESQAKRVIACFCEGHALVLYVYVTEPDDANTAVLTYYMPLLVDDY